MKLRTLQISARPCGPVVIQHRGAEAPSSYLLALLAVTMLASAACGGGASTDGDAATTNDASGVFEDSDGDGYNNTEDCDDSNPQIYPGISRECQSSCAYGVQTCLISGDWTSCNALTDCDCENPGDTRLVECGMCGEASQECDLDLIWSFPGTCFGEGECAPGEVGVGPCEKCGTASRLCEQQCSWGPWDTQACFGDCTPGDQEITNTGCNESWEHQLLECNSSCDMEAVLPCSSDCLLPARASTPDFKDEVCVSAGVFIMGSDVGEGWDTDEQPEHTVTLSAYYIDVYEVSVARYEECVNAGVCTLPNAGATYFEVGSGSLPVNKVDWNQAVAFCAWDGGRRLLTEAEWEKAARGPTPREVSQPWGDTPATCDLVPSYECPNTNGEIQPVDAFPLAVSYYGVYNLAGNLKEWCHDYYDLNYYSVSPTLDPQGPPTGAERVIRGWSWGSSLADFAWTVPRRRSWDGNFAPGTGFRCARNGNL